MTLSISPSIDLHAFLYDVFSQCRVAVKASISGTVESNGFSAIPCYLPYSVLGLGGSNGLTDDGAALLVLKCLGNSRISGLIIKEISNSCSSYQIILKLISDFSF